MCRAIFLVLAFQLSDYVPIPTPPEVPGYKLEVTGSHHGDQVRAKHGETWWAIFHVDKTHFDFQPVYTEVHVERDGIVDDPKEPPTGRQVRIHDSRTPLFMVYGMKDPKPGPLEGMQSRHSFVEPGRPIELVLPGVAPARLVAAGKPRAVEYQGTCYFPYTLTLESEGKKQILVERDGAGGDGSPRLVWAGDLDRDGKVDLLLDLTDHENVSNYSLFLSSERAEGQLVRFVAHLRTTGC